MEWEKVIKLLHSLVQLDIDAWHAYDHAIDKCGEAAGVREKLVQYREDHRRHVTEISARLQDYGEKPPSLSPSFKGYLIEGFTTVRSVTGVQGALAAMRTNEQLTNRKYADALENDLPPEIRPLIEANYRDEQTHLRFIEDKLDLWVREKSTTDRSQRY